MQHEQHFRVDIRPCHTKTLTADLFELPVSTLLGSFISEHRPGIPQSLYLIERQSVFKRRPNTARSSFRSKRDIVAAFVLKSVHLFLHYFCRIPDESSKQMG